MASPNSKEFQEVRTSATILDSKWDGRSSFTLPEVAVILGISAWQAYEAAKKGELPVIEIGRRKIVPRVRLERLMNGA